MKIPKIFHTIWIGGKRLPDEFVQYRETWMNLHPDWEFILWNDENLPELINQKLFNKTKEIVVRADLLKLELLYSYGGIFIDTDFECYKNIEPLLSGIECFSCGERPGIIGNAIMGSLPGHPSFKKLINNVEENINENMPYGPNIKTGPVYLTKTLTPEEIYLFPTEYFFPVPAGHSIEPNMGHLFPKSYGVHHWAASWVGVEEKKDWGEQDQEKINEILNRNTLSKK